MNFECGLAARGECEAGRVKCADFCASVAEALPFGAATGVPFGLESLLHIYAQFYKVCFHWNLDRKQVLKPGGALQPT